MNLSTDMAAQHCRNIFESRVHQARLMVQDTRRDLLGTRGPNGEHLLSGEARRNLEELKNDIDALLNDTAKEQKDAA